MKKAATDRGLVRAAAAHFLGWPCFSAAVSFELGGEVAMPGGECAPAASSGAEACGAGGTNAPGSVHGGVSMGGGASLPSGDLR
jgi:hypothetical protein